MFVVLYEVSEADEAALDQWDGADAWLLPQDPRCGSARRTVTCVAWLYVLNDYEGGLPSARYLGIMADAAEAAGAPADYVGGLRLRPCKSAGS